MAGAERQEGALGQQNTEVLGVAALYGMETGQLGSVVVGLGVPEPDEAEKIAGATCIVAPR